MKRELILPIIMTIIAVMFSVVAIIVRVYNGGLDTELGSALVSVGIVVSCCASPLYVKAFRKNN